MNQTNPFSQLELDADERTIELMSQAGELTPDPQFASRKPKLLESIDASLQKKRAVTVRVNRADLAKLKAKAERLGIPYQTLLGSVVHQYVSHDAIEIGQSD
jgi:predicted DNA binding CopG/RHH family protein